MASRKDALKLYSKILLLAGAGSYAYLYQKCKTLKEQSMDFDLINAKKD